MSSLSMVQVMTNIDETTKKSFEFAQDTTKQLITLSTGIVAITLTFFKDFAPGSSDSARYLMTIAWVFFLVSIFFGVLHLLALTGALSGAPATVWNKNAVIASAFQQIAFMVGLVLAVSAGAHALENSKVSPPTPPPSLLPTSTPSASPSPAPSPTPSATP